MANQSDRERTIYAEMLIASALTVAAVISGQTDQQVIDRYKTMLQVLRVKGTQ